MKTSFLCLLLLLVVACKNNIPSHTEQTNILWVSGLRHECESVDSKHCLQIQNGDAPQLGLWKTWADSISNFQPEFGYTYKIKVLKTALKKRNASPNNKLIRYTLQEVLEKKIDNTVKLYDIWGLYAMDGNILNSPNKRPKLEINLSNNSFLGNGFCNQISGEVHALNNKIEFSKIVSTRMACKNLDFENQYLNILQNTLDYKIVKNQLILYNSQGKEILKFKKLD